MTGGGIGLLLLQLPPIAHGLLEVVALDVHDDHVGEAEGVVGVRGGEGFLLQDAAGDHRGDLRVLRLHGGDTFIKQGDFPVGTGGCALDADDELAGLSCCFIYRIGDDPGHDGPHEAVAHDHDDFVILFAVLRCEVLEAAKFCGFILLRGEGELFAVGGGRVLGSEF